MRLITSQLAWQAAIVLGAGVLLSGCCKTRYSEGSIHEPSGAQQLPATGTHNGWVPGAYPGNTGAAAASRSYSEGAPVTAPAPRQGTQIVEPSGAQAPAARSYNGWLPGFYPGNTGAAAAVRASESAPAAAPAPRQGSQIIEPSGAQAPAKSSAVNGWIPGLRPTYHGN